MIDFDEVENIYEYKFTYLTGILLQAKRDRTVESESQEQYLKYCIQEVKSVVVVGCRKYGEFEEEWVPLKRYITEIEEKSKNSPSPEQIAELVWKTYILLDQAYILLYEGFPISSIPLT